MLFLALLAFLRWYYGAPAPRTRKALKATIHEQIEELASMRAKITRKQILKGRIPVLEEQKVRKHETVLNKEVDKLREQQTVFDKENDKLRG